MDVDDADLTGTFLDTLYEDQHSIEGAQRKIDKIKMNSCKIKTERCRGHRVLESV